MLWKLIYLKIIFLIQNIIIISSIYKTFIQFKINMVNLTLNNKFIKEIYFIHKCLLKNNLIKFKRYNKPNLSIIIPVYNSENYLMRLLQSIQNQKLKEIEIIFVDDCSKDNSSQLLNEYSKIDNRIILIKNNKNKGTLYSYVKGSLLSKGKYIMFLDHDDILLSNLHLLYKISKKYNKDINDFSYIIGTINEIKNEIKFNDIEKFQPELSETIFSKTYNWYTHITQKIYKANKVIRAFKTIKDEYLNAHLVIHGDTLLFICICIYSDSYKSYSNLYSQFYIQNNYSLSKYDFNNYNDIFRSVIYLVKYVYELEHRSKELYNNHCEFAMNLFEWPLSLSKNNKFNIDNKFLFETVNKFLDNKMINNKNINKIKTFKILIKKKTNIKLLRYFYIN